MKRSRGIRPEHDRDEGGTVKSLRRFLVRHGEKIAAGLFVIVAVGLALQVRNYQPLSWQPKELEELTDMTETIIADNEQTAELEAITVFDYAAFANQMREKIPAEPYRCDTAWSPVLYPPPLPRSGFEILTAYSLRGGAVRRVGLTGGPATQWQRPLLPETAVAPVSPNSTATIWINLYGTIPLWEQWNLYKQVLNTSLETQRPEYVYYEWERTEINSKEEPDWKPVIVYLSEKPPTDRLIPFGQSQEALENHDLLLFSDFDVEPAKTYAYRLRLYVRNPNYNLQETSVEAGVDTKSEFVQSDWSAFVRVYVPDRTLVLLSSVAPTDPLNFPQQTNPLRLMSGTLILDYFDVEQGLSLPLVEKREVRRGMLGNMSKNEANRSLNRGNTGDMIVENYPDAGLRSDVCVMDFSGGRRLQKTPSREAQASPDLSVPGKALLLMPDGAMQVISTESELFR